MKKADIKNAIEQYIGTYGGIIRWYEKKGCDIGILKNPKLEIRIELDEYGYRVRMLRPREDIGECEEFYNSIPGLIGVRKQDQYGLESVLVSYTADRDKEVVIARLQRFYKLLGILGEKWTEPNLEQQIKRWNKRNMD